MISQQFLGLKSMTFVGEIWKKIRTWDNLFYYRYHHGKNLAHLPDFRYNIKYLYRKISMDTKLWCRASNSHISIVSQPVNFWEVNMGKYIGYILCILVILFALEYFQIVDIPYFDIPDLQSKGEEYKKKSEDNMRRQFGDWNRWTATTGI